MAVKTYEGKNAQGKLREMFTLNQLGFVGSTLIMSCIARKLRNCPHHWLSPLTHCHLSKSREIRSREYTLLSHTKGRSVFWTVSCWTIELSSGGISAKFMTGQKVTILTCLWTFVLLYTYFSAVMLIKYRNYSCALQEQHRSARLSEVRVLRFGNYPKQMTSTIKQGP
jgi:hypothetical protein